VRPPVFFFSYQKSFLWPDQGSHREFPAGGTLVSTSHLFDLQLQTMIRGSKPPPPAPGMARRSIKKLESRLAGTRVPLELPCMGASLRARGLWARSIQYKLHSQFCARMATLGHVRAPAKLQSLIQDAAVSGIVPAPPSAPLPTSKPAASWVFALLA